MGVMRYALLFAACGQSGQPVAIRMGRNRLADVDTTGDDRAINRRDDGAVIQIGLGLVECTLLDFHVRFSLMQICQRLIELGLGGVLFRHQRRKPQISTQPIRPAQLSVLRRGRKRSRATINERRYR